MAMGDDLISRLPDDLLISILSRLTITEAMVTSVLSRRWERLWTFYHGNLVFEISNTVCQKGYSYYARLVSKVLDTLDQEPGGSNSYMMDSISIRHNLGPDNLSSVDKFVQFALEKRRVKRLNFDAGLYFPGLHYFTDYDFPLQCYAQIRQPPGLSNIQELTSIRFCRVNISGEIVEHFLSNCPRLQSLDLIESHKGLIHLKVSGETLALRHLRISNCHDLTTVEISAPNLVSLNYMNSATNTKFDVRIVSKLVEFSFGASDPPVAPIFLLLLSCFSNLQKLELVIWEKEPEEFMKLSELTSIKHLTLKGRGHRCQDILNWTPLLKAFPVLQKFTLEMFRRRESNIDGMTRDVDKFPNQRLKVFEFIGFGKQDYDITLVKYFLKKIVPLEEIIIRCEGGSCPIFPLYNHRVEEVIRLADKLKQIIPKEVKLVVS